MATDWESLLHHAHVPEILANATMEDLLIAERLMEAAQKARVALFERCFEHVGQKGVDIARDDPCVFAAKYTFQECKEIGDFLQTYQHVYRRVR